MEYRFKNQKCPRCGGNLYLDRDFYAEGGVVGWYEQGNCLQCGYISYGTKSHHTQTATNATTEHKELLPV